MTWDWTLNDYNYILPEKAQRFIKRFDSHDAKEKAKAKPFKFKLVIPDAFLQKVAA